MVILDTCAIIDICETNPSLSEKTQNQIKQGAYILSISFAEIACKIKLKKLQLNLTANDLYQQFQQISNIDIIPIGVQDWFGSIELKWEDNKDPADRLIVAFAHNRNIPIVTTDEKIQKFYKRVIW